jgi:adhesin transport system membrane fusion protein
VYKRQLLTQEAGLKAEEVRLKAEVALNRTPTFPEDLRTEAATAVLAELDVLEARFAQLDNELAVLEAKLAAREADLAELLAQREKLAEVMAPLEEEAALTEDLASRGAVPRIELLQLRGRLADMRGERAVNMAREETLKAQIAEARNEIEVARAGYVLTARQRLARLQVELAVVQENLRAAEARVTRRTLKAPIRGTVNAVNVTTIGQVIEPGAPLFEIVPLDDSLLIQADVRPSDVAFIEPGERASVKISAYDYLVYGALEGEVTRIGADTVARDDGTAVFEITVRTDAAGLVHQG